MAYIGNTVENQGFTPAIDYFNGDGVTVTFTLSRPIASVAQVIVAIDNVIQNPNSSFTVAGNAITFSSAPLSGTNNIWVEYTSLITTYNAISQDPTVIGDIRATGGYLAEGDFGNSFVDGVIVDYVTGLGRVTVGTAEGIALYNGGTASRTALMTVGATGNVGIGTSSPSQKLDVVGDARVSNTTGNKRLYIGQATPSANDGGSLEFQNSSTQINWAVRTNFNVAGALEFCPSSVAGGVSYTTPAMLITSAGDVGIGTNNPQYPLTLVNSTANKEILFVKGSNTNTGTGLAGEGPIAIQNTNNTVGNMAAISNFDSGGSINGQINFINTDQAAGGAIGFTTRTNGGASYGERMRVTENGGTRFQCENYNAQPSSTNFGVEINNTNASSTFFGQGTGTESQITFGNRNGVRGSIQTNASNTLYNTTSDYRLKENVAPMVGALAKVQQLKPSTYTWKVDGSDGQGFIAHELQAVIPDAVTGEKDAVDEKGDPKYQMVDTSFLVATLTAAIQEQQQIITDLKARIEILEAK
jgi:hypothetical protein